MALERAAGERAGELAPHAGVEAHAAGGARIVDEEEAACADPAANASAKLASRPMKRFLFFI